MKRSTIEMARVLENEGLNVTISGSIDFVPTHLRDLNQADEGSLVFYNGEDSSRLNHLQNCTLICRPNVIPLSNTVTYISTEDPKLAYYILAQDFAPTPQDIGVHHTTIINPNASIHPTAIIGPYCVLGNCTIGENTILGSHVTIYTNTVIGKDVMVEANSCVGATGQVWAWGKDGKRWELPQVGGVHIHDGCFIGSNVTVVRGALQDTTIEKRVRITHGSRIGHNCIIGEGTFVSNGVSIPGSVRIGKDCFLGSSTAYLPGVEIGNNVTVGAGSVVTKNFIEKGMVLAGNPARQIKKVNRGERLAGIPKR